MGNICSVLLGIGLQIGAGWIGHRLYPCVRMGWVIAVCCLLQAVTILAALEMGDRQTRPRADECRALKRREALVWLVWLGMLMNALALGIAVGAAFESVYVWIEVLMGLLLTVPLMRFALCWPSTDQRIGKRMELNAKKFPLICWILDEAVRRTGYNGRIRLYWGEGTASCFVQFACDGIIVSPFFLSELNRQELLQVFLHELAHLTDTDLRREIRWRRLAARTAHVGMTGRFKLFRLATAPLLVAGIRFGERLERYRKSVYLQHELAADARAASLGDEKYTASAAMKAERIERLYETDELEQEGIWLAEDRRLFQMRIRRMKADEIENETDAEWLRETERLMKTAAQKKKNR